MKQDLSDMGNGFKTVDIDMCLVKVSSLPEIKDQPKTDKPKLTLIKGGKRK